MNDHAQWLLPAKTYQHNTDHACLPIWLARSVSPPCPIYGNSGKPWPTFNIDQTKTTSPAEDCGHSSSGSARWAIGKGRACMSHVRADDYPRKKRRRPCCVFQYRLYSRLRESLSCRGFSHQQRSMEKVGTRMGGVGLSLSVDSWFKRVSRLL